MVSTSLTHRPLNSGLRSEVSVTTTITAHISHLSVGGTGESGLDTNYTNLGSFKIIPQNVLKFDLGQIGPKWDEYGTVSFKALVIIVNLRNELGVSVLCH